MQRHEITVLQWCVAITALVVGLTASMRMGGYALWHFPIGTITALGAAVREPWLLIGLVPGGVLAAMGCWACNAYLFNGFEGYRYARFIRGTKMENACLLNLRIRQHNADLRRRTAKRSRQENASREREAAKREAEHQEAGNTSRSTVLARPGDRMGVPGSHAARSVGGLKQGESPRDEEPRPAVSLCGVEMPTDLETQNLVVVGAPGTGKSQSIEGLIASAIRREDRLVVVDPNGTMMSKFLLPGDVVINPYDARCVGWSLFNEADHEFDFERLSHSAIPPQKDDQAEEWASFARDVLSVTMSRLNAADMQDMTTLVDVLVKEERDILKKFLEGSEAAGFFGRDAERATASIIFTLTKYIRPLRRIPDGDFSIRRWMQNEEGGNIWITWREDQRMALEPTIPIWLDLVYAMILSEAPSFNRRLWVVMNELASLGRLNSFEGAVSRGRKHGLCVVGDLQDLVQMDKNFGELHAKSALGCFRSLLALGGANAVTTERVARMIGEHEVERHPIGVQGVWKTNTRDRRHESELVVKPSELSNLPDMQGYLLYGKDWPLAKVKFPVRNYAVRHDPFIERKPEDDELDDSHDARDSAASVPA